MPASERVTPEGLYQSRPLPPQLPQPGVPPAHEGQEIGSRS